MPTDKIPLATEDMEEREFIKPVLPESHKQELETLTSPIIPPKLVRFGVILESFDERIVSELTRDLLNLIASLPATNRLVVCSPNSGPLWDKLKAQLPVDFQFGGFELVPLWKSYWINEKPKAPEGIVPQLSKRVANPIVKRVTMKRGLDTTPTPINPDAGRMLPLGQNPSFRRQPTMAPVTMTPQLYLWSSRAPTPGEKVLVPGTDIVENIVSVAGTMAKIGSNHISLDMREYAYFAHLNVWAPRSTKKDPDDQDAS